MKEKSKHMNIPKIRFKGFEDTWKNDKIGNIGSVLMCKRIFKSQTTSIGDIPFYKIGTFGSTADAFISENLFNEYKTRFSYPQYGDILLSAAGTIGRIVEYKGEKAYFQDSNIVWVKVNGKIKNQFLKYIYSCIKWNGLEGSTIKRLYNNNILETAINYPSPEEQQKIASYFLSLDSLIQITSKKLASLKRIKAASLQSMFPQKGETVPKVRFKGFEGKWKNLTLGEIGKWSKGRLLSKSDLTADGKNPCIHYGELFVNYSEVINEVESYTNVDNGCYSEIGDILFPDSDVTATGLARCSAIMQNGVILGGGINILKVDKKFYSPYISYSINQEKGQIISRVIGTTVRHINSTALSEVQIAVPSDIKEQQQIADYFTCLDKQITLQAQRLEKLKQIKAACLDKMFV